MNYSHRTIYFDTWCSLIVSHSHWFLCQDRTYDRYTLDHLMNTICWLSNIYYVHILGLLFVTDNKIVIM